METASSTKSLETPSSEMEEQQRPVQETHVVVNGSAIRTDIFRWNHSEQHRNSQLLQIPYRHGQMEPLRTAQELPNPLQLREDVKIETCASSDDDDDENGFQMKLIKEEDPEDEHYFYGGTSTSVERRGFTNPVKKEEDEDYLCGGTSTCVEEEKIPVETEGETHLSQMETKSILKPSDHHSHQPLQTTEALQYECGSQQWLFHQHQSLDARDNPYPCPYCGKRFQKQWILTRHQIIHQKPFKCLECGRSFSRKSKLQAHQPVHREKKLHQCSQCKNSFSQRGHLKMHQSVHAREILLNYLTTDRLALI